MNYLVDIPICTYNQEKYLAQNLEGIVNQKTNFAFRAFVGDDCSTDNTRKVIEEYAKKYPDIIIPQYRKVNVGVYENSRLLLAECKSKYIAFCDGDDYWVDPLKLQSQVDILENNPNVSLCYHNIGVLDERFKKGNYNIFAAPIQNATTVDVINTHFVPTASMLFRNLIDFEKYSKDFKRMLSVDIFIELMLSLHGTFYHIDKEMAVYRFHDNSMTSSLRSDCSWVKNRVFLYKTFNDISKGKFEKELTKKMISLLKLELKYLLMSEKTEEQKERLKQNKKNAFEFLPFFNALGYYLQTFTFNPEKHLA